MQYPLISEYVSAIQDASDNLDELAHLVPVLDDHGEPYRSSGAFAVVFKMKDEQTGKCYALKCFTEEQEGRAEAYRQIADELEFVDSSYITSVKYLDKEIFVDSSSCEEDDFPVLLMDWIDGETMETYIAENYQDNYAMAMLCYRFCKMAAWLRSQPFAHGDIKPDNIMVRPDGNLTLVDYDGMFVPAMKGQKSPTIGTKDFSHPQRTVDDFDETIDDFALASIALSLKAISLKPSLLDEYGAADRLLFSAEDYRDLSKSKVLTALQKLMNDEEVNTLLSSFLQAKGLKRIKYGAFSDIHLPKTSNQNEQNDLFADYTEELRDIDNMYNARINLGFVFDSYKRLAEKGNLFAMVGLGSCYCYGRGVSENIQKGIKLIRFALDKSNPKAYNAMGILYELGIGVSKDIKKGLSLQKKSAELGYVAAQYNLGRTYLFGQKGIVKSESLAFMWFEKAASQGLGEALYELANAYMKGIGVAKNVDLALCLYKSAFSKGVPSAKLALGELYFMGKFFEQDRQKAYNCIKQSAESGVGRAQALLGLIYCTNEFMPLDYRQAEMWIEKALDSGYSDIKNIFELEEGYYAVYIDDEVLTKFYLWAQNHHDECMFKILAKLFEKSSFDEFGVEYSVDKSILLNAHSFTLDSYVIDSRTKEIKAGAFVECRNLTKLVLPNALEKIGDGAFEFFDMLERLTIPRSVIVLEGNPFSKWDGQLICLSPNFSYNAGVLMDNKRLISYRTYMSSYKVRVGIEIIEKQAFEANEYIRKIQLPATCHTIGNDAFMNCTNLNYINISNAIKEIGGGAFYCSGLTELEVEGISVIKSGAFGGSRLKKIKLGCDVKKIEDQAFIDSIQLEEVILSEGLIEIDEMAFANCKKLKKINIPNSLKVIKKSAFVDCASLDEVIKLNLIVRFGKDIF